MSLRVLVVDDEALARARLKSLLADCRQPGIAWVAEAADAVAAMQCVLHQSVDVVLADIHMPGVDGLTLVQNLQALPNPPAVVFVTAHTEHAVQAFELEALDFLTKPVRLERLEKALQKVLRRMPAAPGSLIPEDYLVIHARGRTERVAVSRVLYLKAELKYISVHTRDQEYLLEGALADLESRYGSRFIRIHRNALVARHAVRALEKHNDAQDGEAWTVRLDGVDEALAVSRRQLGAVRALLSG